MKKITFVKDIDTNVPWHTLKLWKDENGYILTSAVDHLNVYETMVFKADLYGKRTSNTELGVVHKLDHEAALADAGYDNILP